MLHRSALDQALAAITTTHLCRDTLETALGINHALNRTIESALKPLSLGSTFQFIEQLKSAHRKASSVFDSLAKGVLHDRSFFTDSALAAMREPKRIEQELNHALKQHLTTSILPANTVLGTVHALESQLTRLSLLHASPEHPADLPDDTAAVETASQRVDEIAADISMAEGIEGKLDAISDAIKSLGTSVGDRLTAQLLSPLIVSILTLVLTMAVQQYNAGSPLADGSSAHSIVQSLAGPHLAYVDLHTVVLRNTQVRAGRRRTSPVVASLPRGSVVSSTIKVGRLRQVTWRSINSGELMNGWIRSKALKPLR